MSQRTENVDVEFMVDLKFKVTINSFSNHDGFIEGQIDGAVEEFKDSIKKQLEYKLNGEYQSDVFLYVVDYVNYEVDSQSGL